MQVLPINVAAEDAEETDEYYIKIVKVTTDPSAIKIGNYPTYKVQIEYNFPQNESVKDWAIEASVTFYNQNGVCIGGGGDAWLPSGHPFIKGSRSGSFEFKMNSNETGRLGEPVPNGTFVIKISVWSDDWGQKVFTKMLS